MKKLSIFIIVLFISFWQVNGQELCFRDSINVLNYSINLSILDFEGKTISGNTELKVLPVYNNSNNFALELKGLNVDSIFVNQVKNQNWVYKNEKITIQTEQKYNKTDTVQVNIYYQGRPVKDARWGGFYFSKTDAFNMGVGMASYPHGFGRVWYPCIDNFTDKATYDYFITVSAKNTAVCSGELISVKENKNKTKTFHWQLSDEISTYISSVAVAEYEVIETIYKGIERDIPVKIYVSSEKANKVEDIFANLHKALKVYENLFGAYSWQRAGYVEVSFNAGAMEHATNIAYPSYAFSSYGKRETLMTHELSHAWFGNLVTCKTSEDMWLNEGWASYCEALFIEFAYGKKQAKEYVRDNHFNVITGTHISDKGYLAVAGVSKENTYGSTVYDKGSDVVHSLRGYMGDSLFFGGVKEYLNKFAFKTASSNDLCEFLSSYSGIDLTDFFDYYVRTPGFNFYEITGHKTKKNNKNYSVTIDVTQRTVHSKNNILNNSFLEITFLSENYEKQTEIFEFSGKKGQNTFTIPFEPKSVMLDIDEKISDATIDNYKIIKATGLYEFDKTLTNVNVTNIKDSVFLRMQTNWLPPSNTDIKNYELSPSHYWTVQGILNDNFKAKSRFYYKISGYNDVFVSRGKNIVLLYRPSYKDEWEKIDCFRKTNYYEINELKVGDYVFAKEK